jgi:hypothetical protein
MSCVFVVWIEKDRLLVLAEVNQRRLHAHGERRRVFQDRIAPGCFGRVAHSPGKKVSAIAWLVLRIGRARL